MSTVVLFMSSLDALLLGELLKLILRDGIVFSGGGEQGLFLDVLDGQWFDEGGEERFHPGDGVRRDGATPVDLIQLQ